MSRETDALVNLRHIRVHGLAAGRIEEADGRFVAYSPDGSLIGDFSTERRAIHALSQDVLRQIYRPARRPLR